MNKYALLKPHGENDRGWKREHKSETMHYFLGNSANSVEISHCFMVVDTSRLSEYSTGIVCPFCKMIEDLRVALDGKNEQSISS